MVGTTGTRKYGEKNRLTKNYKKLEVVKNHVHPCPKRTFYIDEEEDYYTLFQNRYFVFIVSITALHLLYPAAHQRKCRTEPLAYVCTLVCFLNLLHTPTDTLNA